MNDKRFDLKKIALCRTFRQCENNFIMRQFGYEDIKDYHRDCNFDWKLNKINVPTIFLNAADDMFSPKRGMDSSTFLLFSDIRNYLCLFC
jgi:predicted alpha/beta-fold hydrolase